MIYVANGSHANYSTPGSKAIKPFAGVTLANDETARDRNRDGKINDRDGAYIFDTAKNLKEVTSQDWYPKGGREGVRWGEIGVIDESSGPRGPSKKKGAVL